MQNLTQIEYWEEYEDIKGVIRIRQPKKNRQHNDLWRFHLIFLELVVSCIVSHQPLDIQDTGRIQTEHNNTNKTKTYELHGPLQKLEVYP